tara:strand:+ start:668 stop:2473 length:1806 start_codon:yes stop_codon:yes gene_type:complete
MNKELEYIDRLLRSAIKLEDVTEGLNGDSKDSSKIFLDLLPYNPKEDNDLYVTSNTLDNDFWSWLHGHKAVDQIDFKASFSEQEAPLNPKNLNLILLLLNKNSVTGKIFWKGFSEAWLQKRDLKVPLSIGEIVEILDILKKVESKEENDALIKNLFSKFNSFIKNNGILSIASWTHIETPIASSLERGSAGSLKMEQEDINGLFEEEYSILLNAYLALQGISPLKGDGRERSKSDSNTPSERELNKLTEYGLISSVDEEKKSLLSNLKKPKPYHELVIDNKHKISRKNQPRIQYIDHLELINDSLANLITKLEKLEISESEDESYLPVFGLDQCLRRSFSIIVDGLEKENPYLNDIEKYQSHLSDVEEEDIEEWYKSITADRNPHTENPDIKYFLHYFAPYTNHSLSKIFINSIKYLKACIYARYCLEKFELTPRGDLGMNSLTEASLTLLANFSSIKTLKNQLSRKESPIFLIKPHRKSGDFNDLFLENFIKFIKQPDRNNIWKEFIFSGDFDSYVDEEILNNVLKKFDQCFINKVRLPKNSPPSIFSLANSESIKKELLNDSSLKNKSALIKNFYENKLAILNESDYYLKDWEKKVRDA